MLRYAFSSMSHLLSRKFLNAGYEIYTTNDARFLEQVYKICIHYFNYFPVLTNLQFMNPPKGYAERKIVMVMNCINYCLNKHTELSKDAKNQSIQSTSAKKQHREKVIERLAKAQKKSQELAVEVIEDGSAPNSARNTISTAATRSSSKKKHSSGSQAIRNSSIGALRRSQVNGSLSTDPRNSFHHSVTFASTSSSSLPDDGTTPVETGEPDEDSSPYFQADVPQPAQSSQSWNIPVSHSSSPIKKAWVHDHIGGSNNVSVIGYVQENPNVEGSRQMKQPHGEPLARKQYEEFQLQQELLRKQQEQTENERIQLLKLQHQEYTLQNPPHVQPRTNEAESLENGDKDGHAMRNDDLDEPEMIGNGPLRQQPGFQSVAANSSVSASAFSQSRSNQMNRSNASSVPPVTPSKYVVGDEYELNQSFNVDVSSNSASQNPSSSVQLPSNSPSGSSSVPDLNALNDQLNEIAKRTNKISKKVASSPMLTKNKQRQPQQPQQQQIPSIQYQAPSLRSSFNRSGNAGPNFSSSIRSSPTRNTNYAASSANPPHPRQGRSNASGSNITFGPVVSTHHPQPLTPPPSTAALISSLQSPQSAQTSHRLTSLETKLLSMVENMQAKMLVMQGNMEFLSNKLELVESKRGLGLGQHLMGNQANAGISSTHADIAANNPSLLANMLRNPNLNQLRGTQQARASSNASLQSSNGSRVGTTSYSSVPFQPISSSSSSYQSVPSIPAPLASAFPNNQANTNVNQLTNLNHLDPVVSTSSRHNSPFKASQLHSSSSSSPLHAQPSFSASSHFTQAHISPARKQGYIFAEQQFRTHQLREQIQTAANNPSIDSLAASGMGGKSPMKIPIHVPHTIGASSLDVRQVASSPTRPLTSHTHGITVPVHLFNPTGSSAIAHEQSQGTDNFIEQLRMRLKQTEELITTAKQTARANESTNYS